MGAYETLLDHIESLRIIDTHEHLPFEADRSRESDVLSEWLGHYFSCDLVSAGLSDEGLATVRDSRQDLQRRWTLVEPYWHAAESTGYGRSLALAAQGIYGIDVIDGTTLVELDRRFRQARERGGHYRRVLSELSRIDLSVRDTLPNPYRETPDRFVFTMRTDDLVFPTHVKQMRALATEVGLTVHTLEDWETVIRRQIERHLDGRSRVVCLKSGAAYLRSLRFDKVGRSAAEEGFHELFADRNLPDWRAPTKASTALSDWLMHCVCRTADDLGLVYQIHTGIQEGNGNFVADSNPVLLSNLFLEYRNVRFDVFHMGYPYVMELGNLAKNFRNVFIDMCWGHIISPEAARRALVEWLDVVPANKISAFGGDYNFVDGVYGHQALARRNVASALARKVDDGSFSLARAVEVATWLFVDNPRRILGLDRFLDR